MLLKTCFSCGNKVKKMYDSLCEDCYMKQFPPIKEMKPMAFKICNQTRKIFFNNTYHDHDHVKKMLPSWIKSYLTLNEKYQLKEITVENFNVLGHKLVFDIVVDCDLKKK